MTVYFEDKDPILIENRAGVLFPTMYLLAKNPKLVDSLNVFGIHSGIVEKLQKGADLMAPGIVKNKPNFLKKLDKHDYIYLRIVTESQSDGKVCSPILAIAQCLMASHEMVSYNLSAGRFAKIVHIIDDTLWQTGSQKIDNAEASRLCIEAHPWIEDVVNDEEFPKIGELAIETDGLEPEAPTEQEIVENIEEQPEIDLTEVYDRAVINALLHCLKTTFSGRNSDRPDLPILNSTFYSKFIMPLIISPDEDFNLKLTSFKSLPKFLDSCENQFNLIKTRV